MQRPTFRTLVSTSLLAALIACGIETTAPRTVPSDARRNVTNAVASAATTTNDTVLVVRRLRNLDHDLTASALIDATGGTLSIPDAGVTLTVPPGALAAPTTISITAKAGPFAAYEFEPHGTHFPVALVLEQKLNPIFGDVASLPPTLQGSYYATDLSSAFVDPLKGLAHVLEERPVTLTNRHSVTFTIEHFSGYMLSSGRGG